MLSSLKEEIFFSNALNNDNGNLQNEWNKWMSIQYTNDEEIYSPLEILVNLV